MIILCMLIIYCGYGTSNIDCILLMNPRFAALAPLSLNVSPQCEGIQQMLHLNLL